jgi:hypothetical protein
MFSFFVKLSLALGKRRFREEEDENEPTTENSRILPQGKHLPRKNESQKPIGSSQTKAKSRSS